MNVTFPFGTRTLAGDIQGSGPRFVWLHALTSSRSRERQKGIYNWDSLLTDYTVVRYDAVGHGQSSGDADEARYQWARMAEDLVHILDRWPDERVVLGGASMGSVVSLWAALNSKIRVAGLVLATPPSAWDARAAQAEGWSKSAHIIEKYGLAELRRRALSRSSVAPLFADHPELQNTEFDVVEQLLPAVLRGAATSDLPTRDLLSALDLPALILAWKGDPDHPVTTAQAVAESLPQSELHVASDFADTKAWPAVVRAFIGRVSGRKEP